jgi:photosystem II stability/assembly factor-like uncharacterized protein
LGTTFGLLLSTDSGASWNPPDPELALVQVNALTSDPSAPGSLFAATNAGVMHSSDAGGTWDLVTGGPVADVWAVAADPYAVGTFYAATRGNLFKTSDNGLKWERLSGLGHVQIYSVVVIGDGPGTVVVGTGRGIFRSQDGGRTWVLGSGLTYQGPYGPVEPSVFQLASAPGSSVLYAPDDFYIYRSADAGATWETYTSLTPLLDSSIVVMGVDPSDSQRVYAMTQGNLLFMSPDGGLTWALVSYLTNSFIYAYPTRISVDPADRSRIYLGTAEGLYRSTDGGKSFADLTSGIPVPDFINEIITDVASGQLFVAADSGTFVSTDGGDSWTPFGSLPSGAIAQSLTRSPADPSHFLCGTLNNGAFSLTLGDYPIALGDVNGDGTIDIRDVFSLLDHLFANSAPPGGRLDANGDGHIDIADVFYLINYLFAGGTAPPGTN